MPIHAGSRHTVERHAGVVLKRSAAPAGAHAAATLRHEFELLRDLALPGVVRVRGLVETERGLALQMDDAGDANLAQLIRSGPLSITAVLSIAVQLAEAVARLHGARIIHGDVHPGNVVWDAPREVATLCDFALARKVPTLSKEGPGRLEGALPYMSPEQTGRTGRPVDWRADLYSLGATIYATLTGEPPFAGDDAALAHAQIARVPRQPHELDPRVPLMVSRIVLKLLEKDPEQRYQSAAALAEDLREAQAQWARAAAIAPFPLAAREVPRALSIPDKLYGRDDEVRALADALARTRAGGRELMLVTGDPGIGKSALVDHLRGSVGDGAYAAGKFDQLQRSVPFAGLAQALRSLVRQLLTEPEPALDEWRAHLAEAVGPNGQLLIALVPELERLLGAQPPVPDVGPLEARNRFHLVVTRFLRVFARAERPLVLFLDDLQWIDAASLQLLEQWVSDAASRHLLLVGAYRDQEVGASHPLALALAGLRDSGCELHRIHLRGLGAPAIAQLAADTLREDVGRTRFLADLIIRKSAGNPFFVRRLLHLMHAQGLFRFEPGAHRWTWDEAELERAPIADNVLELMMLAIGRLPAPARRLLETGACIGHQFELATLAHLTELTPSAVSEQLGPAIEDGLLIPVGPTALRFAHDRVQQAAYGLLSEARRPALHHAIGRRLLDLAGDDLDEHLFEIVDQLDLGEAHVDGDDERRSLVDLNLAAGRKAKASAAYRAAFEYVTVARRQLGARAWEDRPELAFAVHRELAESAYLAGEEATAEELVEICLAHAPSRVATAELYGLRVVAATVATDWPRALRWGREGLSVFGLEWPLEGLTEAIGAEVAAVMKNVGDRDLATLVDAPDVDDPDIRAIMHVLSLLGAPAYFSGSEVLTFVISRAVNLSLVHGPSPSSAFAYVLYGGIHNALTGQYDVGYAFGKLALALAHRFGNRAETCRTFEVYGVLVHHWKAPLREGLPLLKAGFRAGVESGELAFAAFNLNSVLINALPAGLPLPELLDEAAVTLDFAIAQKNKGSAGMALPFRQLARALTGATARPDGFDDHEFTDAAFLEEIGSHETALGHYWVTKLQLAYLSGDLARALACSREAATRIPTGILGMITSAEHVYYTALTLARTATPDLDELRALHGKLATWATYCPENFAHKVALVGAELARIAHAPGEAMALYRAAIDGAERQRFIQDEALAHELRARFLRGEREPELAAVHARLAQDRYRRWGAAVKVAALEREFGDGVRSEPPAPRRASSLDELALIKASQAIASAATADRLFEQILRVVVEVAGAQCGALILPGKDGLVVHGQIEAAADVTVSLTPTPVEHCVDLPASIPRYVMRAKEVLLLADATAAGLFAADPVVQRRKLRSVLCIPLVKQAAVVGVIYLEHNAMAGAFTEDLIEIGRVLAAQAVISLENSTLTSALEARVVERTRELTDQIAARDKAEAAVRVGEARRALLLGLSDELRTLSDPQAMRRAALQRLGEHLGLALGDDTLEGAAGPRPWTHDEVELIREVAARTEAATERARAEVALREADKQKDDFLAMLGHELRNPLAPISTAVHLLKLKGKEDVAREVAVIERQSQHIERLVDDLLDVSRITQGKVSLNRDSVEVADLIAAAIELASPLIEQGRHTLTVNVAQRGLVVDVDRGRMMQVFANLLTNAAKYTPPGGRITITASREDGDIVIAFKDTGTGISPELLPRVFELFVQSRRTIDRAQGGLGLGLAIVKNLVAMHGGSVTARSEGHGLGSTFTVRLPDARIAPRPDDPRPGPAAPERPAHGYRVLIVDDNVDGAELLGEFLELHGHRTATAHDGFEALRIAAELQPQLALLDIGLPGMDGYQLATLLRERWADVKLVAITGYGQESDRERAHRSGFDAHLTKPVNVEALGQLVAKLSGA